MCEKQIAISNNNNNLTKEKNTCSGKKKRLAKKNILANLFAKKLFFLN